MSLLIGVVRQVGRLMVVGLPVAVLLAGIVAVRGWERSVEDLADCWVGWHSVGRVHERPLEGPETKPVAIVPGAGVGTRALVDRVRTAARLYHAGKVERILVSGDGQSRHYDEPGAMTEMLLGRGVPEAAIMRDCDGVSTRVTMQRAADEFGIEDAWVVTQRVHAPRSVYLARAAGIDAVAACTQLPGSWEDHDRERRARVKALLEEWGVYHLVRPAVREFCGPVE